MMETRTHRLAARNRKKGAVPLSKLRTSEAVRTIVDHPRRIEELVGMFEDKDRVVRSRAAAALARLSDSHPGRLLRILERIREALRDDSAYVRWHAVHCLGSVAGKFPGQASSLVSDLLDRLDDENRIVRILSTKALRQIAGRKPKIVEECFKARKKEIPLAIARILQSPDKKSSERKLG